MRNRRAEDIRVDIVIEKDNVSLREASRKAREVECKANHTSINLTRKRVKWATARLV